MLRKVTSDIIGRIMVNEKEKLLESLEKAGNAKDLFEIFVLIISAQGEEYGKLFDKQGYLPKDYVGAVMELFQFYAHGDFFEKYDTAEGLKCLFEESHYLANRILAENVVFIQARLTTDGKILETVYSPEDENFQWPLSHLAHGLGGISFRTHSLPIGVDIEIRTKRIPCSIQLLISIITRILDDDNWKMEADGQGYEGWVFQWDQAYKDLFEVTND